VTDAELLNYFSPNIGFGRTVGEAVYYLAKCVGSEKSIGESLLQEEMLKIYAPKASTFPPWRQWLKAMIKKLIPGDES